MSIQKHLAFWAVVFAGFIGFVFVFKSVLLPFVLGAAVAYFLNPVVNVISPHGKRRGVAALLILSFFMAALFLTLVITVPILHTQMAALADNLPALLDKVLGAVQPYIVALQERLGLENGEELKALITAQLGENAKGNLGASLNVAQYVLAALVGRIAAGGQAVFDVLSVAVFMPIVAYFMMKEWPAVMAWGEELMPEHSKSTIKDLLKQIDQKISGFVRGQISVAVMLAIGYAIALSIAGLNYGVLIGVVAGLLSIIPMVGSVVGLLCAVVVAWFQLGEWQFVAIVAAIFFAGQIIEGNFLTPKLVGGSVGLHPLWVFFALLAGGSLFGILGMFLAVPVAAVIGVLVAFGIARYKASDYFKPKAAKAKPKKKAPKKKKVAKNAA